jgi:hypothetical protein
MLILQLDEQAIHDLLQLDKTAQCLDGVSVGLRGPQALRWVAPKAFRAHDVVGAS